MAATKKPRPQPRLHLSFPRTLCSPFSFLALSHYISLSRRKQCGSSPPPRTKNVHKVTKTDGSEFLRPRFPAFSERHGASAIFLCSRGHSVGILSRFNVVKDGRNNEGRYRSTDHLSHASCNPTASSACVCVSPYFVTSLSIISLSVLSSSRIASTTPRIFPVEMPAVRSFLNARLNSFS